MGAVIARPPLPPGPFLVLGLARSGVAAALALRERGSGWSRPTRAAVGDEVRDGAAAAGAEVRDGEDGADCWTASRTVVKSPGVPREAPSWRRR